MVLHDADAGISYWVHVTRQAAIAAGRGARILVPVDQVLDDANRDGLLAVAGSTRPAVHGGHGVGRRAQHSRQRRAARRPDSAPSGGIAPPFADFVLGPLTAITATGTLTDWDVDHKVDQQEGITVTNATGALGVLHASMLAASPRTATICDTDGRLDVSGTFYLPTAVTLHDRDRAASDRYDPTGDVPTRACARRPQKWRAASVLESPSALHPVATSVRIIEALDEIRRQLGVHFPRE